jgi:GNAT superfamily N-acetyltransferase
MPSRPHTSNTTVTIRPARAADTTFILGLLPRLVECDMPGKRRKTQVLSATRTLIRAALRAPDGCRQFFIATDTRGWRCGFVHLELRRDFFSGARECHVDNIIVSPHREGRGIGTALLAHAETWAHAQRCALLTLNMLPGNTRARALYDRCGFAPDLLRMAKPVR